MKKSLIMVVLLMVVSINAGAADQMQAFPAPGPGMERFVLKLAEQKDESGFKIELIVGKTIRVDTKNKYFLGGEIKQKIVKGWGYPFYSVDTIGPMAGTLMAVAPGTPKVERFITLGGEPVLIPYRSGIPVVVYVPHGVEVRYRLWTGDDKIKIMEKN